MAALTVNPTPRRHDDTTAFGFLKMDVVSSSRRVVVLAEGLLVRAS
jgi:hypothetical protein